MTWKERSSSVTSSGTRSFWMAPRLGNSTLSSQILCGIRMDTGPTSTRMTLSEDSLWGILHRIVLIGGGSSICFPLSLKREGPRSSLTPELYHEAAVPTVGAKRERFESRL